MNKFNVFCAILSLAIFNMVSVNGQVVSCDNLTKAALSFAGAALGDVGQLAFGLGNCNVSANQAVSQVGCVTNIETQFLSNLNAALQDLTTAVAGESASVVAGVQAQINSLRNDVNAILQNLVAQVRACELTIGLFSFITRVYCVPSLTPAAIAQLVARLASFNIYLSATL